MLWAVSQQHTVGRLSLCLCFCLSSACRKDEFELQWFPLSFRCLPVSLSSYFSSIGEASVQAFFFFFLFPNAGKEKVFILIIKISLFCILQYISNISTMKHSLVQHGQEGDDASQRHMLPGTRLGGAPAAATLHHLFHLVHKRRPVRAFERVFPSLAPQGSAALPSRAPTSAFQPGHLLGRLARGVALLLLVIISYPLPSTREFCKTTRSTSICRAVTVSHTKWPWTRHSVQEVLPLSATGICRRGCHASVLYAGLRAQPLQRLFAKYFSFVYFWGLCFLQSEYYIRGL